MNPNENLQERFEMLAAAARRAAGEGLMRCSSGNMSWRIDEGRMLVTATRTWMRDLRDDQVVVCRIADGEVLNGLRPSVETTFHAGILRSRDDVEVVLHFQTPAATTFACRDDVESTDFYIIPEIPYYIGPIAVVPYLVPGSPELAEAVVAAMADHDMAILRNHGLVTVGKTFDDAIQKAVFFELACDILLKAGAHASPLTAEAALALRDAATGKGKGAA